MTKKVSVIIPAYNKAALTVKTVESVLGQTYENIEIIVVDDGSTDDTAQRMASFGDKIQYIRKENGGACSARNRGIRSAQGDYLAFLDCDDMYLPEKIEKAVEYLETNTNFGFVHTPVYMATGGAKRVLRRYPLVKTCPSGWIWRKLLLKDFSVINSTVVVRRSCVKECGFFDEAIFTPADWDMWLRLAERYEAGYMNEPLTVYDKVSGGYIPRHLEQSEREGLRVLEKAFQRNCRLSRRFKNQCVSNLYLRHAYSYSKINNTDVAREKAFLSIQKNMFNLKAFVLIAAATLLGKNMHHAWKRFRPF